jgi:acetyl-CoA carboxylase biotin carboxylase subunit
MGDKTSARELAIEAGVPLLPAVEQLPQDPNELVAATDALGYPLLLKAAAGGGGKGMRVAQSGEEAARLLDTARAEARAAFGDDRIYAERYIERPRHVEVQVLADCYRQVVHLGERECSIQRRGAVAWSRRFATRAARIRSVRVRAAGALRDRRHRGVSRGCRRRLLFPRDEHAPPGRACGDRSRMGR